MPLFDHNSPSNGPMRPVFLPYSQGRLGIVSRGNGQNLLSPLKRLLARSFIFPRRKNNPRPRLIGLPKTMKTPKMGRVNPAPSFFPKRETVIRGRCSQLYFAPICP